MAQPTKINPQLRSTLTAFGALTARLIGDGPDDLRILTEAEAIEPMRHLLRRYGIESQQGIRQADGRLTPTWYEAPQIWIKRWGNSESFIALQSDAAGPVSMRFVMRTAADTVTTTFLIGKAAQPSARLLQAAWDAGIRTMHAEIDGRDVIKAVDEPHRARP